MDVSHALAGAVPKPFWLDDPGRPEALPELTADLRCGLAVVGGGYSGLWTALLAKERDPDRDVVLLEGARAGWAASGRNGGFCAASLTHGLANGIERFPDELRTLIRLGAENLDAIEATLRKYGIDCAWERTGEMNVATAEWQAEDLRTYANLAARYGEHVEYLDRRRGPRAGQLAHVPRGDLGSGRLRDRQSGETRLGPARCLPVPRRAYLRAHPGRRARKVRQRPGPAHKTRPMGNRRPRRLSHQRVPSLLKRVRPYLVPVYDYALMTEPLSAAQLAETGWRARQGIGDSANQFHYYRLTADNRILWGGYDAIYHYGNQMAPELDQRPATFTKLAQHFFRTFPHLEGLKFTHTWGGVIDTCTRFCAFFGTAHNGRVAYAAGYTGLGVGATRFGANVMLDQLGGAPTELTELQLVRTKPLPFPPEPVRSLGVNLTRWSLDQADRNNGQRNVWLRALDRFGLGFDS